jgi:hypothetical protein
MASGKFSSTEAGIVPESGGGTSNFLRADGTWAAPPAVGGYATLIVLGNDVASTASVAFQNITGLSFSVTSGVNYRYYGLIHYVTSAATIGIRVSMNGPTTTLNSYITTTPIIAGGSLTTVSWVNGASAIQTGTVSTGSMNTTAGNIIVIEGIMRPSANGTFQLQFAPETATANGVIIKAGSTLEWW